MKVTNILNLTTCILIPFAVTATASRGKETYGAATTSSKVSSTPKGKVAQLAPKSFLSGLCSCCSVQEPLEEQVLLVKPSEKAIRDLKSRIQNFETRVDEISFLYDDLSKAIKHPRVKSVISKHSKALTELDTRKEIIKEGLQKIDSQEDFAELLQELEEMEHELEEIENVIYTPYKMCAGNVRVLSISDLTKCNKYLEKVMGRKEEEESNILFRLEQAIQEKVRESKDKTKK